MSVHCLRCGHVWPRDPALAVRGPTCRAPVGTRCRRPSGHTAPDVHAARDQIALMSVPGYGRCPAPTTPAHDDTTPTGVVQTTLF